MPQDRLTTITKYLEGRRSPDSFREKMREAAEKGSTISIQAHMQVVESNIQLEILRELQFMNDLNKLPKNNDEKKRLDLAP